MKERQIFRQTYRKPWPFIRGKTELACVANGFEIIETRLLAAGRVLRGDEELEYQDVRVYVKGSRRG